VEAFEVASDARGSESLIQRTLASLARRNAATLVRLVACTVSRSNSESEKTGE
jgi:hypothetical protein